MDQNDSTKQITYLAAALKAPRVAEAADRLANQARDANWSFEDYLAAVLEREVSARQASGAELRIRARGLARTHLALQHRRQVVLKGPVGVTSLGGEA